jgi:hypothetical protein
MTTGKRSPIMNDLLKAYDDDETTEAYTIYGSYRGNTEEIDTAEDLTSAEYLVGEYKLAYGKDWDIWYEDAQGNRT